jgi:hypothetical protein
MMGSSEKYFYVKGCWDSAVYRILSRRGGGLEKRKKIIDKNLQKILK